MSRTLTLQFLLSLLCCFFFVYLPAQQATPFPQSPVTVKKTVAGCGTEQLMEQLRKNPAYKEREDRMNREIAAQYNGRSLQDNNSYVLPVVVHIINDKPYSITDKYIIDGIQDLNDAFSKSGKYAASQGADTKISFCLAKQDPDGGITNGITRTESYFSNTLNNAIEDDRLKNLSLWDPQQYINIWLITGINNESYADFSCGAWTRLFTGAYATMPPNGSLLDGIVVPSFGVVMAHEMGHYLGLYHTFQNYCSNYDCAATGDFVCDTPPDGNMFGGTCGSPGNSCRTDTLSNYSNGFFTSDVKDQEDNFMDYADAACQNRFTEGQADRMRIAITTQRSGLLVNKCNKPCADKILAGFTRDIAYPVPGNTIQFTNASTGAASYQWLVDGVPVAATANFQYQFTASGKYKVTLKAFNNAACFSTYTDFIIVTCGVTARFWADKRTIASRAGVLTDSILFTNTSVNAVSYQWLVKSDNGMAEQVVSTDVHLNYTFLTPGSYSVRLIADNGGCLDTTEAYQVPVAEPTQDGAVYLYAVNCYEQTKVRASFYVCNHGYQTIPANTPVSFYDADPKKAGAVKLGATFYLPSPIVGLCCGYPNTVILDVKHAGLNELWVAFNDSGSSVPVVFPNTGLAEINYNNNIDKVSNFSFHVTATPATATLEPGDTILLTAIAGPIAKSYAWSTSQNLSCPSCDSTALIAVADVTKQVIATSVFNCIDTAYVVIKVPPADDYTIQLTDVQCAGNDSLHIDFTVQNLFKRGIIPKGLAVSFYNGNPATAGTVLLPAVFTVPNTINAKQASFSTTIKGMPAGTIYAVVNDSGKAVPVVLPNTAKLEKVYSNNGASFAYKRLLVTATPAVSVLEPGDTVTLTANATPGIIAGYQWSSAANLSCIACQSTDLIAVADTKKQVVATNSYGCTDTALVEIQVPPADDYTIQLTDVQCAANDQLHIEFTVQNLFKRGIIPKGLAVSFYNGNPATAGTVLLPAVFTVPNTVNAKQASFSTTIKGMPAGTIYAVVNDSGKAVPVVLPNTAKLEKNYTNNVTSYGYQPERVALQPADTTVFRKDAFPLVINTPLSNAASTTWFTGTNYTLSCTSCVSPVVTVNDAAVVPMQTLNGYGCFIKGESHLTIFPPDMTIQILNTSCYSNSTTLVQFEICMNNRYDSVWTGIPVSFYDSQPLPGTNRLSPVFYTTSQPGACHIYEHIVSTPATLKLYAVVNDLGTAAATIPNKVFDETRLDNNASNPVTITPFAVSLQPNDTMLLRQQDILLVPTAGGGTLVSASWQPSTFLSCTNCIATIANPTYTTRYQVTGHNEKNCTDTASVIVRTFTGTPINIPTAFTPNGDGLNDIFYVMAGAEARLMNDFSIYNRWGERVYSRQQVAPNDPAFGWNGMYKAQPVAAGAYVYAVTMVFADGSKHFYKGTVVLIR